MKKKCLVSVSGGRTSGMMAYLLNKLYSDQYEFMYVFANTGREREETLEFVRDIQLYFGLDIVWVESVVAPEMGDGVTHKIVDFESANRNGQVFEEVIKKYRLPCVEAAHCTKNLKTSPINHFAKSIGWKGFVTAIGFRADEPKRVNLIKAKEKKHWYPLWEHRITKKDVLEFWKKQSFDLKLVHEYEGNCKLCYKKSKRKLLNQINSDPESTEWIERIEEKYSDGELFMFRNKESIHQLKKEAKELKNQLFIDFDYDLDEQEDCAESCEPF